MSSVGGEGSAGEGSADDWVELADEVAFQAADDLHLGFTLRGATFNVVPCGLVIAHPYDHHVIQRGIGLAVASSVQPMPVGLARGCWNRASPGKGRESGLGTESGGVIAGGDQQLRGRVTSDTEDLHEFGGVIIEQPFHVKGQVLDLFGHVLPSPGQ